MKKDKNAYYQPFWATLYLKKPLKVLLWISPSYIFNLFSRIFSIAIYF